MMLIGNSWAINENAPAAYEQEFVHLRKLLFSKQIHHLSSFLVQVLN